MRYRELPPGNFLKPYIKCYYLFESEAGIEFEDTVFPSGSPEIIFNLGDGVWHSAIDDDFSKTPPIELWGQITRPMTIRSAGKQTMLGIRFFAHSASHFFKESFPELNDQVLYLGDLWGSSAKTLHFRLLDLAELRQRIDCIEHYLIKRLAVTRKSSHNFAFVGQMVKEMNSNRFPGTIEGMANRYGFTARYVQKLFLQSTGLTPKLYSQIQRFQSGLRLLNDKDRSLTSIAYDCGYFDQSHFIREFRSFTGLTPSSYQSASCPVNQVLFK